MSLVKELKRRNVIRVALFYIVSCWLVLQIADLVFELLLVPDWTLRFLFGVLLVAFPFVLFLAWAFELTPEGVRRESEVDRGESITPQTGRRLDLLTILVVIVGIGMLAADRWFLTEKGSVTERSSMSFSDDRPASAGASDDTAPFSTPNDRSIAVLPFVSMSSDPENEYFADGLSEELLNQLAQIPGLMVAGRTSSFSFKGKNEDLREIGAMLGVANVLEGSVRRQADQVRVTAQLIRARDGYHLWSNTYDRELKDVFVIQDDIARNVADAMKIILDEDARSAMEAVRVRNVEAFVEFQKGKELFELAHGSAPLIETLEQAMPHFERAIELVPDFGAAWWTMADYYGHLILEPDSTDALRSQAVADLRRVLDQAHRHSMDPSRRAFINVDRALFSDDWTTLPNRIKAAIAADGCPDPNWIELANSFGYAQAVLPVYERQARCEPLSVTAQLQFAFAQTLAGNASRALEMLGATRDRFGVHPWLASVQQIALLSLGRIDEALALAPEFVDDTSFFGWTAETLPHAAAGRIDAARAALARWEERHGPARSVAVLAAMGDREAANTLAAEIDARPAGPFELLLHVKQCVCGHVFDLDATPNLKARIEQAGVTWPPPTIIEYPAKDW